MIAEQALPEGFVLHELDRVDSTNEEVRRRAAAGAGAGLVVLAGQQTQGRGRHGRTWTSPKGNFYASVLVGLDEPVSAGAQLSFVSGLAISDALARNAPDQVLVQLKWPNDVLIGHAKVAGILLETAQTADGRSGVIIGTGVNIVGYPSDTPYPATCLAEQGFAPIGPRALLATYLAALDHWIRHWRRAGFGDIRAAWCARSLGLGEPIQLRLERENLSGRFLNVTASGSLLLDLGAGERREIAAGDVFYPAAS